MFKLGTVPFIGDYIDISPAPAFVPAAGGKWVYNTAASATFPLFHATWTDNRDVRPPADGNWANYTPPTSSAGTGQTSLFDPSKTVEVCIAGNAGSRNQNIYTARIGGGLQVGAPGNSKQLSTTLQRGFVVFAQNDSTTTKTFRMTVLAQPVGGRASFDQFPLPPYTAASPAPKIVLDVRVPPRSTASRTLFVTSSDPRAQVLVDVTEVANVGGPVVTGGLVGRVVINPDIDNPDIDNPDIDNSGIVNPDIDNAEIYNPDIDNPDIDNPDIDNPDIDNPDIDNPDIDNVRVANPDIDNLNIATPDIDNPDIDNPDIDNPDIDNPDIDNGTISDVTWTVSNIGNTTSAFNVNLFLANAGIPAGITTQLVVYKTYKTPVLQPNGCDLRTETRNVLMFNANSPNFITSSCDPRSERSIGQERDNLAGAGRVGPRDIAAVRQRQERQHHRHQPRWHHGVDRPALQPDHQGDARYLGTRRRSARSSDGHQAAGGDDDGHEPVLHPTADDGCDRRGDRAGGKRASV